MRAITKTLDSTLLFVIMLVWMAVYVVPRVYNYFYPPVTDFTVETVVREGDSLYMSGSMVKDRCRFAGINATGQSSEGVATPIPISFMDSQNGDSANRARGTQAWGPWRLGVSGVRSVHIEASHWCRSYGIGHHWAEYGVRTVLVDKLAVPQGGGS